MFLLESGRAVKQVELMTPVFFILLLTALIGICSIIAVVLLIRIQKKQEKKVRRAAFGLKRLLDSSPAAMISYIPNQEGEIQYANTRWFELVEQPKAENSKQMLTAFLDSGDRPWCIDEDMIKKTGYLTRKIKLVTALKKERSVIFCGAVSESKESAVTITAVLVDISEIE